MVRFERAPIGAELRAKGDAADPFAAGQVASIAEATVPEVLGEGRSMDSRSNVAHAKNRHHVSRLYLR
jgi:hypothetical protein